MHKLCTGFLASSLKNNQFIFLLLISFLLIVGFFTFFNFILIAFCDFFSFAFFNFFSFHLLRIHRFLVVNVVIINIKIVLCHSQI